MRCTQCNEYDLIAGGIAHGTIPGTTKAGVLVKLGIAEFLGDNIFGICWVGAGVGVVIAVAS